MTVSTVALENLDIVEPVLLTLIGIGDNELAQNRVVVCTAEVAVVAKDRSEEYWTSKSEMEETFCVPSISPRLSSLVSELFLPHRHLKTVQTRVSVSRLNFRADARPKWVLLTNQLRLLRRLSFRHCQC